MSRHNRVAIGILLIVIATVGVAWGIMRRSPVVTSNKLSISTSFYPLWFFASQIGGQYADVHNITPSGAEPHDYEPTSQDVVTIESGNLLILNGGVEAWGDKLKASLKGTKTTVVVAGQGLLTHTLTENGVTGVDPHVWLQPQLAADEAQVIANAMIAADPVHATTYQENLQTLLSQLSQLDTAYRLGLSSCKQTAFVTSHAAFGYLAEHYGLTQQAIAGLSPDAEPSTQQLADVTAFAKKNNVRYIFFESLVSPKLAQTIAAEVGAKTLVLDPLEGVSPQDQTAGRDYVSIMTDNLHNLQLALQCTK